jgi:hypothetical protein
MTPTAQSSAPCACQKGRTWARKADIEAKKLAARRRPAEGVPDCSDVDDCAEVVQIIKQLGPDGF